MALTLQSITFAQQYISSWLHSAPSEKKTDNPLKLGVLSTAAIDAASVIRPAETHPDVILYAIASRDAERAQDFAQKYGFTKAYPTYPELLDDPSIDIVYVSLPNSLHFEWAAKALRSGKHVLLEKPFTSNATEAKKLVSIAEREGKILMEAFHWQFHPAAHAFRRILDDTAKHGRIVNTRARMTSTPWIQEGDIRWQYDLSGGSLMDMTYVLSFTRFALNAKDDSALLEVASAHARPAKDDPRVDSAMEATLLFSIEEGQNVSSTIYTDMQRPWALKFIPRVWEWPSIEVETTNSVIYFYNAMMPHVYHYISIKDKKTGQTRYEKHYNGDEQGGKPWWSTYRYQLEAFVDKVRGREPAHWITHQESVAQMEAIDQVYEKAGLPLRPTSKLVSPSE